VQLLSGHLKGLRTNIALQLISGLIPTAPLQIPTVPLQIHMVPLPILIDPLLIHIVPLQIPIDPLQIPIVLLVKLVIPYVLPRLPLPPSEA
jgi:hypothetical protein